MLGDGFAAAGARIRARDHDDRILATIGNRDKRRAGGQIGLVRDLVHIHAIGFCISDQLRAELVCADSADQNGRDTPFRCRDRLVQSLAARQESHPAAHDRLTGLGQIVTGCHDVHVQAAEDDQVKGSHKLAMAAP